MKQKAPKLFIWDFSLCMTVYWMCTGTLIAKLTESLGLSVAMANMVVALPSMTLLMELLGGFFYSKTDSKHKFLVMTSAAWRVLVPCVFYSALLPKGIGAVFMVICYIVMVSSFHISAPAYNAWLVNSTSGHVKSNYLSVRDTIFIALFTLANFLYGMIANAGADAGKASQGFAIIATIELVLAVWSMYFLFKKLPAPIHEPQAQRLSIKQVLKKPFETKGFSLVISQNILWNFAAMFISNFGAIYQVRVMNIDFSQIVVWGTVGNVMRVLFTPIFAKVADKIGWKITTQLAYIPIFMQAILWMVATPQNVWIILPIASICGAIPHAGLGIGLFKYQVAYSQPQTRSLTFSVCSAASGAASLAGTAACTVLVAILETFAQPPFWVVFAVGIFFTSIVVAIIQITPYKEQN